MIKAIKVLNLFSIFLFAAILLLIYAYLPIQVELSVDGIGQLHKQTFFYYVFVSFIVLNIVLRFVANTLQRSLTDKKSSWVRSIIFILNFYFTTIIGFIGVINNSTHISPNNYAYLTYLGPVFLVTWLIGLIFLLIKKT